MEKHSDLLVVAAKVHCCNVGGSVVFIQLSAHRYFALDSRQSQALAARVRDWPVEPRPSPSPDSNSPDSDPGGEYERDLVRRLLSMGLLSTQSSPARPNVPVPMPAPARAIELEGRTEHDPPIELRHLWQFTSSYVTTVCMLRWYSLSRIARRVHRQSLRAAQGEIQDEATVRDLTNVFRRIRMFFYSSYDQCLKDSLVLLRFLSSNGVVAHWRLGVELRPFGAHSWVQRGDWVLSDSLEHVRQFTPIFQA